MISKEPFSVRGAMRGPSSICGQSNQLPQDHVPPKDATRITAVEMQELHGLYADRLFVVAPNIRKTASSFRRLARPLSNQEQTVNGGAKRR